MAKKIFIILLCTLLSNSTFAQKYYMGIGGRAGKFYTGASFKYFFNSTNSTGMQLEAAYANITVGGYNLKGFIIKQIPFKVPIIQLPLDFVYGAGVHAGYFPFEPQGYYKKVDGNAIYYTKDVVTVGVDATIQIEYKIPRVPFTLTIDVVPFYEFVNRGPEIVDFGVSIRYVFK
ncbi:MAG: hypothetical protein IPN61_09340 [Bacteroidetes bacterium]|nr:hypothetical protein [Bacteroidota bacterium]MBK9413607.1 hypothetical protein [Bacteroidota bacterium]MBP6428271.1 hypothetical protein [Bacteroidia bacterium]